MTESVAFRRLLFVSSPRAVQFLPGLFLEGLVELFLRLGPTVSNSILRSSFICLYSRATFAFFVQVDDVGHVRKIFLQREIDNVQGIVVAVHRVIDGRWQVRIE